MKQAETGTFYQLSIQFKEQDFRWRGRPQNQLAPGSSIVASQLCSERILADVDTPYYPVLLSLTIPAGQMATLQKGQLLVDLPQSPHSAAGGKVTC